MFAKAASVLGLMVLLSALLAGSAPDVEASSGAVTLSPVPKYIAKTLVGTFTVDVVVQNLVVTTTCYTDPNDPLSPQVPCGLGAFEVEVGFDPAVLQYVNIANGTFLGSTGRSISCQPAVIGVDKVDLACSTLGALPMGPQGNGTLATITFDPVVNPPLGSTPITFSVATLTDIYGRVTGHSTVDGSAFVRRCPDVTGDSFVTLGGDVGAVLAHTGQGPASPGWNAIYDLDQNNSITLGGDVGYALSHMGQNCTYF